MLNIIHHLHLQHVYIYIHTCLQIICYYNDIIHTLKYAYLYCGLFFVTCLFRELSIHCPNTPLPMMAHPHLFSLAPVAPPPAAGFGKRYITPLNFGNFVYISHVPCQGVNLLKFRFAINRWISEGINSV